LSWVWHTIFLISLFSEQPHLICFFLENGTSITQRIFLQQGDPFVSALAEYSGEPCKMVEISHVSLTTPTRFAADNLEFCCSEELINPAPLCYDPCFFGGVTMNGRCKCFPGFTGPHPVNIGEGIILADNCNTQCTFLSESCLNVPDGQGKPAEGPCGPCTLGTSGKWQQPLTGQCFAEGFPGVTNGDDVIDFPGEPSCQVCFESK